MYLYSSNNQEKNPKFIFEESFLKEIKFEDLENSFLEINIYSHSMIDNSYKITSLTKNEILNSFQKYCSLKLNFKKEELVILLIVNIQKI